MLFKIRGKQSRLSVMLKLENHYNITGEKGAICKGIRN